MLKTNELRNEGSKSITEIEGHKTMFLKVKPTKISCLGSHMLEDLMQGNIIEAALQKLTGNTYNRKSVENALFPCKASFSDLDTFIPFYVWSEVHFTEQLTFGTQV